MKIALIMNENSYPGREYIKELISRKVLFDVISIGSYPQFNVQEDRRCAGLWTPPQMTVFRNTVDIYDFDSLKDSKLIDFLHNKEYDLGIQGGTGIIKRNIIQAFKYGILNFHPGDLPEYRGCSAPEWQLIEGRSIICTCHLVDEGIDTGRIYKKRELFKNSVKNYHWMRSQVYKKIAEFVGDVFESINPDFQNECYAQDESRAIYREYIGDGLIEELIDNMK